MQLLCQLRRCDNSLLRWPYKPASLTCTGQKAELKSWSSIGVKNLLVQHRYSTQRVGEQSVALLGGCAGHSTEGVVALQLQLCWCE